MPTPPKAAVPTLPSSSCRRNKLDHMAATMLGETPRGKVKKGDKQITKAKNRRLREISLELGGRTHNENAERCINRKLKKEEEMIVNYNVL